MLFNTHFKSDLQWPLKKMTRLYIQKNYKGLEMRLRIYQIIITTSKTQVTWLLFFADRVIKVSRTGCLIY